MPKSRRPDPAAYARAAHSDGGGRPDWLRRHPAALADLTVFVREWRAGRSDMSCRQAADYLREHHGYPRKADTLRKYVLEHYGEVFRG